MILFTGAQAAEFLALFDDDALREVARCIFVDGKTNKETADAMNYSLRQIEHLRSRAYDVAIGKLMTMKPPPSWHAAQWV